MSLNVSRSHSQASLEDDDVEEISHEVKKKAKKKIIKKIIKKKNPDGTTTIIVEKEQ